MSSREILAKMGAALGGMGVGITRDDAQVANKAFTPTVPTTADLQGDQFMNQPQVEALVDLTVSQSAWLSALTVKLRNQRSGTIPRMVIGDVVTEGVNENGGATIATSPDMSEVPYTCAKFQATWYLTLEDIGEARAAGEIDFDGAVRRAFAKAMGNDMARMALRGDTSIAGTSRLNRLLNRTDGVLKKARGSARYLQTTYGSTWNRSVYAAMHRQMPDAYKDDPDLRWLLPPKLDEDFVYAMQNLGAGAALQDQALVQRRRYAPMGVEPLLVPQWPTDQGFATLAGSTSDADAIVDDGDGTLTATVDSLFGGYSASHAGRIVRITCGATGQSEDLVATVVGGALKIMTSGSLGQSTISTTASEYTLDLADCTGQILTNPRNLFLVLCRQFRSYRKFEQESERWRVDVFYEAATGIFNPDALVLQEGIVPTAITFGS